MHLYTCALYTILLLLVTKSTAFPAATSTDLEGNGARNIHDYNPAATNDDGDDDDDDDDDDDAELAIEYPISNCRELNYPPSWEACYGDLCCAALSQCCVDINSRKGECCVNGSQCRLKRGVGWTCVRQ
ncbi:hypothetical protein BDZ91DRAFT_135423 [Kalaharituber pfeilii]|nr:hypothetical protein BDZ91DRAFT_135423 [Kalaharituber pfeilii]